MSDGMNTPPAAATPAPRPRPAPQVPPASQLPPAQTPPPRANPPASPTLPVDTSEYSATLIAPAQIAVSVGFAAILAIVVLAIRTSLWPFAIIVLLAVGVTGFYLAGVSLLATRTYLEIGQGRREREPRRVSNDEIVAVSSAEFSWKQVYGLDLPRAEKTTRLTVRPGATLIVELRTGEVIRISTPEPARAIAALGRTL